MFDEKYIKSQIEGIDYCQIHLTKGFVAWIDPEDYDLVNSYKWQTTRNESGIYYAVRGQIKNGVRITMRMHNFVLNHTPGDEIVDHKFHDLQEYGIIDNRKDNLRLSDYRKNSYNRRKSFRYDTTSRFKGVQYTREGKYLVRITKDGVTKNLGTYSNELQAAQLYNKFAVDIFGDYAHINEFEYSEIVELNSLRSAGLISN
jgi:hypothetical protein